MPSGSLIVSISYLYHTVHLRIWLVYEGRAIAIDSKFTTTRGLFSSPTLLADLF